MNKANLLAATFSAILATSAFAQTTWTNAGGSFTSADSTNWSAGIPTSTSDVIIATNEDNFLGVDVGGEFSIRSLSVADGFNSLVVPAGADYLRIGSGGLTLGSGSSLTLQLPVFLANSSTFNIGGGSLVFANEVEISGASTQITFNMLSGGTVEFSGANAVNWAGSINIIGEITSTSIKISGLAGANLDNFFVNGNPAVVNGDYIVPEPSTYAMVVGLIAIGVSLLRRRRC